MWVDVKSVTVTSTSTALATQRVRVRGLVITGGSSVGVVTLKDGGGSGTTRITINTPAVDGIVNVIIPGDGVVFTTDVHATLTNVASLTIFYG